MRDADEERNGECEDANAMAQMAVFEDGRTQNLLPGMSACARHFDECRDSFIQELSIRISKHGPRPTATAAMEPTSWPVIS